ncbi:HAD family hydrolase [Parasediminibacterium sp. JCM 36343]|uniref:HAD family hydrolase n=1 Tax=Parasediminibacterium sp. JCM 36343 TaxID=3374279 RepID=UPI00397B306A
MEIKGAITTLFVDIGGVLLSNGWSHQSRHLAASMFNIDFEEMENRHQVIFVSHEEGKLALDEYLKRVVFYKEREFTNEQFRDFMFSQTTPFPEMINLIKKLKEKYGLKIAVVSNEAKVLNEYRIQKFQLATFVDFFISSCYVHLRKPDADIFRMALNIAQVQPSEVIYIEDTPMLIDVSADLGIKGILHKDYSSTASELAAIGLNID